MSKQFKVHQFQNTLNAPNIHIDGASKGHITWGYKSLCAHVSQLLKCSFLLQGALFAVKLGFFQLYLA